MTAEWGQPKLKTNRQHAVALVVLVKHAQSDQHDRGLELSEPQANQSLIDVCILLRMNHL